jgi:hypothetical protein
MRKTAFIQALLASFVLSACASGPALDAPPRMRAAEVWRPRALYSTPRQETTPLVDTSAQWEALRRVPHGDAHSNAGMFHK